MPPSPTSWQNRRIFIFGGSGFFGSWAAREFRRRQGTVGCLIHKTPQHSSFLNSSHLGPLAIIHGDARYRRGCLRNLAAFEPDVILHLATPDPRLDETILQACLQLARPVPVIIPVAVDQRSRLEMFQRLLNQFPRRVTVAQFPMLYGIGDYRAHSLLRRAWRQRQQTDTFTTASAEELSLPYLDIRDAVTGLVSLTDRVLSEHAWQGALVTMIPDDPLPSAADLIEACGLRLPQRPPLRICRQQDPAFRQFPDWIPQIPWRQAVTECWDWLNQQENSAHELARQMTRHRTAA